MTTFEIEGRSVAVTNLDKVLWPAAGFTKAQMLEYYVEVAPVLLPHLAGRPLTVRRFPDGVDGPSWHQNECKGEPDWFPVAETPGRGGRLLRFCMVDGLPALVWLVNQAAVELHPFLWTTTEPRRPTSFVFDLDPGAGAGLVEAARVALHVRRLLEELGLFSLVKVSGSLGLHVHVPLGKPHDAEQTKAFARAVAETLARERPDEVVAKMQRGRRHGKVFVDWLQNDATRQTVAPYSLRGLAHPTVAAPVRWDEVERAAEEGRPDALVFLAADVPRRLERDGDLFAPLLELEQALPVL